MLDLALIRKRLARIDQTFWWAACAPEEGDTCPDDREFVRYAPTDIAALLDEVERLRAPVADPCRLCGSPMALAEPGNGPGDEDLYRCSRVGCGGEYARDISEPRFIVRLEPGVWIAPWKGDPGRTLVRASAKQFPTERSARRALSKARRFREFPKATVECVK